MKRIILFAIIGTMFNMLSYAEEAKKDENLKIYKVDDNQMSIEVTKDSKGRYILVIGNESDTRLNMYWGGEFGDFGIASSYALSEQRTKKSKLSVDEEKVTNLQASIPPNAKLVLPQRSTRQAISLPLRVMVIIQFANGPKYKVWSKEYRKGQKNTN